MEVSSSSSSSSEKSAEVIPPTKFEEAELIPQAEWRAMRERFPYAVRKSCTKYKKGQLEKVTDEALQVQLNDFKDCAADGEKHISSAPGVKSLLKCN